MKRFVFRFCLIAAAIIIAGWFVSHQVSAGTVTNGTLNTGLDFAAETGLSGQDIRVTIAKIIRIILGFLGILAVGLVMYAGFIWMTSNGNEEKIEQAKMILRNGVIGLVIILASFGIVSFILSRLIGITTGNGNINGNGNENGNGIGSLGNGIIRSVYPEPGQREVPRNTSILVTFREPIRASTMCNNVTNENPAKCASGASIVPSSIKIFKTTETNPTYLTNVTISSNDNLTFVIKPAAPEYLGSPVEEMNYTVTLTRDIKKANGDNAFNLTDFRWSFDVDTLLDLVSPKIKSVNEAGVFPGPDDAADIISGTSQAKQAQGSITVASQPNAYRPASAVVVRLAPTPPPPIQLGATIEGTNTCTDGTINILIVSSGANLKARLTYSQAGLVNSDQDILNNRVNIGCGLNASLTPGFAAGHNWQVTVQKEKQADSLTVGSKIYTFVSSPQPGQIVSSPTNSVTAQNIALAINAIHPEVTAPIVSGAEVTLRAKVAGTSGNSIELSTSNQVALSLERLQGGTNQATTYSIKGKEDQPKNAVIQINFNESVNPLTVAGTSTEVAENLRVVNAAAGAKKNGEACTKDDECSSYRCSNSICEGNQLAGTFTISNQYRSVEFVSDVKCGVNGCGENIYCLPGNSHLKVETMAANLQSCTTNNDCSFTPFTSCVGGFCQDTANNKNYPTAPVADGVVDLADNSLDGNRNDNPQGKTATYDENLTVQDNAGRGDNHLWSFWVSDRLDLTPPKIFGTSIGNNQGSIPLAGAIEVVFTKLMMSSSLSTGSIQINNGVEEVVHKLMNLWSLANDPIGYWVRKEDRDVEPLDGRVDRTSAFLSHGDFNGATVYQAQVGSGVKDIYQNCYKPSDGPGCDANAPSPSCCRDAATGNLVPTAILTPDGNCP